VIVVVLFSIVVLMVCSMGFFVPRANSWATKVTQIDKLHELGLDGSGVTIGVVDTGCDIGHPEFDAESFVAWKDLVKGVPGFYDDDDHGTHVAGVLVSKSSFHGLLSGVHLQGIAMGVRLVVVKAIPRNHYLFGGVNDSIVAEGIKFCIDEGVDVILLSLGRNPEDVDFGDKSETSEMIRKALREGVFVVAPAGDDGQDDDGDVCFPAVIDGVISVGSVSKGCIVSSFSSKGHQYPDTSDPNKKPELVAPGEGIMSTRINGAYGEFSGTSLAAAYVAGVIALLLDAYPEYKHDGLRNQNESTILFFKEMFAKTAKKIGSLKDGVEFSHDDFYGYGLIQAFEMYKELARY
jgi:serine protease AprX